MKAFTGIIILIYVLGIIGEIKCVVKAIQCNWEPVGKAEIMYTAGALTGFGAIIGWFNIEDK